MYKGSLWSVRGGVQGDQEVRVLVPAEGETPDNSLTALMAAKILTPMPVIRAVEYLSNTWMTSCTTTLLPDEPLATCRGNTLLGAF